MSSTIDSEINLVSDVKSTDYHTRRVAVAETTVDGREVAVASVHSWWDKGVSRRVGVLKNVSKYWEAAHSSR